MDGPEILKSRCEIVDILAQGVQNQTVGVMSYLSRGKWRTTKISTVALTSTTLHIAVREKADAPPINIQINQPVGISIQQDFSKYIFDTIIVGFESSLSQSSSGKIVLELPDRMERMQRRAYQRVLVPKHLNIKVLFWHRGYVDDSMQVPLENYWQGKLEDLSAGGVQIAVDLEHGPNFKVNQFIGLQFTPGYYQKPLLLEGRVKHIAETTEGNKLYVGVQFMGLEATSMGREKIHRLIDIADEYQKQNETQTPETSATNSTESAG